MISDIGFSINIVKIISDRLKPLCNFSIKKTSSNDFIDLQKNNRYCIL
ncbi:hypothetical protein VCHENC01_4354 [Vibrio harveyi]|nr:hypothetical protein VCHENC01_4354 [Vibrio harveyi]